MMESEESTAAEKIAQGLIRGFRITLARRPSPDELDRLETLLSKQLEIYRKDTEGALRLAGKRLEKFARTDPAAVAAWVVVANVLLNLDETITRG